LDTALFHSDLTMKCTKEFFFESLDWLKVNYLDAIFPQAELDNYKQIEAASLQRKTATPRYWANRLCMEAIFGTDDPNTRYAELTDITAIETEALRKFHDGFYHPGQATWIVGGDIDENIKAALQQLAASLPSTKPWNSPVVANRSAANAVQSLERQLENTSQVSMFFAKEIPHISEADYHKFSLLNLILGGFFGSRLMQEIREERGLTYGIGSYISQTTYGNTWCISGEMNSTNAREAALATKELLMSMIENPPGGDELERAKRYYAGQFRSSFDGPFAMAGKLKGLMVRGYSFGHFDQALETIWSTTTDDLWQLANNYLHPETFHSVLAGDIKG
jgi:zinc protease